MRSHQVTDMGNRVEEGILVGLESDFRPTYTYKMYLPHKNAKACSGDVSICEHVGRALRVLEVLYFSELAPKLVISHCLYT